MTCESSGVKTHMGVLRHVWNGLERKELARKKGDAEKLGGLEGEDALKKKAMVCVSRRRGQK